MTPTPPAPLPPRPSPPDRAVERLRRWVAWFGLARLLAAGAAVVLVAFAVWWLLRAPCPPTEAQLPYATTTAVAGSARSNDSSQAAPTPVPTSADVVVHVAGAVAQPGVYHLPAASRVIDAVAAAGGLHPQASTDGVNLAAPVRDGTWIYVPVQGEAVPLDVGGAAPATDTVPPGPVDVNTATAEQLDTLPGIGPSTAAAIIAYRDEHGPFTGVDELGEVRGIGPAKLDAIRELVTA